MKENNFQQNCLMASLATIPIVALTASPAIAQEFNPKQAGDFLIRLRGIGVIPDENGDLSVGSNEISGEATVDEADDTGNATRIDDDDSFGFALQAGLDYALSGNWLFNFDVKKIFLSTDVQTTVAGTNIDADVTIDPWIIGVGVGYRF